MEEETLALIYGLVLSVVAVVVFLFAAWTLESNNDEVFRGKK